MSRKKPRSRLFLLSLIFSVVGIIVGLVLLEGNLDIRQQASGLTPPINSFGVDLSIELNPITRTANGILLTGTLPNQDAERLIPLQPKLYRSQPPQLTDNQNHERFRSQNARIQVITYVDFLNRYGKNGVWPGDNGDWQPYIDSVRSTVQEVKALNIPVEYDIWNEPDHAQFWGRDQQRYFEAWKIGYETIRSEDPQAKIVGPSISIYNEQYLKDFLQFANQYAVLPNVLTWHELDNSINASEMLPRANAIRSWMASQQISVPEIIINEIIGPGETHSPGDTAQYLAAVEYAGLQGAARACWDEADGTSSCWNYSLNGLLTPGDRKPRSTWWVYKAYNDLRGKLVAVAPTSDTYGIATYKVATTSNDTSSIQLLLGKRKNATSDITSLFIPIQTQLNSSQYPNAPLEEVRVWMQHIPSSGAEALNTLPPEDELRYVRVQNGNLMLPLPKLRAGDALSILITRENPPQPPAPTITPSSVPILCPEDINADSFIGEADVAILRSDFGKNVTEASNRRSDINNDGYITINDFSQLALKFNTSCNGTKSQSSSIPIPSAVPKPVVKPIMNSCPEDLNRDSKINTTDLRILRKLLREKVSQTNYPQADLNGDGTITSLDLLNLIRKLNQTCGLKK